MSVTAIVTPKGMGKAMMTAGIAKPIAGVAGQMAAGALATRKMPTAPGEHRGYMVLALGVTRLAFLEMKRGLLINSVGKLLADYPREAVTKFEIGGGMLTAELNVEFEDGTSFALEVPKASKGSAERVKAALGV